MYMLFLEWRNPWSWIPPVRLDFFLISTYGGFQLDLKRMSSNPSIEAQFMFIQCPVGGTGIYFDFPFIAAMTSCCLESAVLWKHFSFFLFFYFRVLSWERLILVCFFLFCFCPQWRPRIFYEQPFNEHKPESGFWFRGKRFLDNAYAKFKKKMKKVRFVDNYLKIVLLYAWEGGAYVLPLLVPSPRA